MDYDETELPGDIDSRIKNGASTLVAEIKRTLASKSHVIENGFNIVLAGVTNVGKSSLFNRILGQERAIVSDIHGTTRDVVTAEMDIDGFLVRLSDTAGIRKTASAVEKIGIEKTHAEMTKADLVLRVFDTPTDYQPTENEIIVINKCDNQDFFACPQGIEKTVHVSALTGVGIQELMDIIRTRLAVIADGSDNDMAVGERMRRHLEHSVIELDKARVSAGELQAEHIMSAADEIGLILGLIGLEDIYDNVFGQLCLGK